MNVTETGYIKLYRSILSNPLANEDRPRTKLEAWLELLLAARYSEEPGKVMVGNKSLIFHRGEIYASLRYLAESWKWSKNKVDGFLSYLEKEEMITKRTDKGTGRTVITICNYAYYNPKGETEGQPTGHERDTSGTSSGQRRDSEGTNKKKDKKGKEGKEEKEEYPPMPPYSDFENYAFEKSVELGIEVDPARLRAKYEAWKENGWKTGKNVKIKNWKTTLLNTLNYLTKEKSSAKKEKERGLEAALSFANVRYNG